MHVIAGELFRPFDEDLVMISIKRILVPTDFSENARQAGRYAVALSERFDAELHVLHVLQDLVAVVPDPGLATPLSGEAIHEMTRVAAEMLARIPEADWGNVSKVVRETRTGPPFSNLLSP